MASKMVQMEEPQQQQQQGPADHVATILAIGTANPPNCIYQHQYPDYYFRVTKTQHMTQLTEDILEKNPNLCSYDAPSLDSRQNILVVEVPKLGKEAAVKAIEEWGQHKSKITHLIFTSMEGVAMPGADYQLTKLLGLSPSVKRVMLYFQGCYVGATALRLAKDFAENNVGSRVLVVSSCMTNTSAFRGPCVDNLGCLVGQAIFGEGAAALIVGANPDTLSERPLFQIVSTAQTIIPDSEEIIGGQMREIGLTVQLSKNVPMMVSENIDKCLVEAFHPFGITDWNSLFWVVHTGGSAILDQIEEKVGLKQEKLRGSRRVISEYGNMGPPSVFFVLDEIRRKSMEEGKITTGEGLDWGVLFGFGPGLTVDTIVLRSFPYKHT